MIYGGKSVVGSPLGIAFEWFVHNVAYYFGNDKSAADPVDIGETIFDDNHDWKSIVMQYAYTCFNPIGAIFDEIINLMKKWW